MTTFSEEQVRRLIHFFLLGMLSEEEERQLAAWRNLSEEHDLFFRKIVAEFNVEEIKRFLRIDADLAWDKVKSRMYCKPVGRLRGVRNYLKYAEMILPLLLLVGVWLMWERETKEQELKRNISLLSPVLKLDNGEVYPLDVVGHTEIELSEGMKAYKTADGLVYDTVLRHTEALKYNTIFVPKGSEYQVTLSDGTRVWLNAASEFRYPITFPTEERRVYLKGEAYFEVTSNFLQPFYVETEEIGVRVLGTAFNINTHCMKGVRPSYSIRLVKVEN